jgi:hypothetical protein
MADQRKLISILSTLTLEEVVAQSAAKLRQLAIDLKIMNIKDATDNDALKGKLWTHLAQQGLCKNSGGGGGGMGWREV